MAAKLSISRTDRSTTINTAAGVLAIEEGAALLTALENGELVIKPSDGSTNLSFGGFAISERTIPSLFPMVEQGKVAAITGGNGIALSHVPVGTVTVNYVAAGVVGAVLVYNAGAPSAGEYTISGLNILVNVADLAKTIQVQGKFTPTIADLQQIGGDNTPTSISTMVGQAAATGVGQEGVIYTSLYDPAINWNAWVPATGLKAIANGIVGVAAGTGVTIDGKVIHAPSVDEPYLGIAYRAN